MIEILLTVLVLILVLVVMWFTIDCYPHKRFGIIALYGVSAVIAGRCIYLILSL